MKKYRTDLTADFLRSVLEYDPETGVFRWRMRPGHPKRWNTRYAGNIAGLTAKVAGYVYIQVQGRTGYPAHRLAWLYFYGAWPKDQIDHINGNRSDNRIANLREASSSDNGCNKTVQKNNTSGYVGVSFDLQRNLWHSRVTKNRMTHSVGFFKTPIEAHHARQQFIHKIHGEFTQEQDARPKYIHPREAYPKKK